MSIEQQQFVFDLDTIKEQYRFYATHKETLKILPPRKPEEIFQDSFNQDPMLERVLSSLVGMKLLDPTQIVVPINRDTTRKLPYGSLDFLIGAANALEFTNRVAQESSEHHQVGLEKYQALQAGDTDLHAILQNLKIDRNQDRWASTEVAILMAIKATTNTTLSRYGHNVLQEIFEKCNLTHSTSEKVRAFLKSRDDLLRRIEGTPRPPDLARVEGSLAPREFTIIDGSTTLKEVEDSPGVKGLRKTDPNFVAAIEQSISNETSITRINSIAGWITIYELYSTTPELINLQHP